MIKLFKQNKYLFYTILFALFVIIITFERNIGLIIDCGREVYYPQEILNGKVLYKDLFNIYSPFAYLINAFLFKIFGVNLKVLCVSGSICAIGIIYGIFLLAKNLINEKFAFCISFFAIIIGILPSHVFNYVFPYAFSMTYGLFAFIFSLLFLINFINSKKNTYLYLSLFFAGFSICCKYEFIPYLLTYIPIFFNFKPKFKTITFSLLSFALIPIINFTYLFLHGLRFLDIQNTLNIIITMSNTQTLKYFYMHCGVFPHKYTISTMVITFCALFIPFFLYYIPTLIKLNKYPILVFLYAYFVTIILYNIQKIFTINLFMSLTVVLLICAILNYKKILKNLSIFTIVASIFLVSLKVFWGIILNSYGIYYLPLIIIAIVYIFKDKITQNFWNNINIYILILSIFIAISNFNMLRSQKTLITTPKGKLYVEKKYETTNTLLEFIKNNTQKTDKILILPEGMMINFLSDRKTDDFYNSFLPLYEETFGIESFRIHFEKAMPEYIILNSWNSSDYYFSIICNDYGKDFCNFIKTNYNEKIKISGDFSYVIFKRK